jgi:hypothetical protein
MSWGRKGGIKHWQLFSGLYVVAAGGTGGFRIFRLASHLSAKTLTHGWGPYRNTTATGPYEYR